MTDTALPLSPGLGVDFPAGAVSGGPTEVDLGAGACLDHVVDWGGRSTATAGRLRSSASTRWLQPSLDLGAVVAAIGSVSLVGGPLTVPMLAALPVVWVAALLLSGAYEADPLARRGVPGARGVVRAAAAVAIGCWTVTSTTASALASTHVLLLLLVAMCGSLGHRGCAAWWRVHIRSHSAAPVRLVVAGRAADIMRMVDELERGPDQRLQVVGVCLPEWEEAPWFDVPVSVGLNRLADSAAELAADAVVVLPWPEVDPTALRRLGWQLERSHAELCVGMPLLDVAASRTQVTHAGGLRLVHVRRAALQGPRRLVKDVAERAAAALALLVLLPALVLLTIAIRWDSPGPAIFRQSRVGKDGRSFTMFKFRTMATDAEQRCPDLQAVNEADGVLFKLRRDPRITRLGSLLRRYSLDELPQLANVVLGHMSLIGPRPALPSEVARYEHDPHRRMAVKPGLTGLWQVSGRSDLSWEETVRLDLDYVDNWSLGLDLRICFRTVGAVLRQRGAY